MRSPVVWLWIIVIGLVTVGCGSAGESPDTTPAGLVNDPNYQLIAIAEEVPGFVGYWFDSSNNTHNINTTDAGIDVEAVRQALIDRDPSRASTLQNADFNVIVVQLTDLSEWYQQAKDILYGEMPTDLQRCLGSFDLDEFYNRILIGLRCEEARVWTVQRISEEIDAPFGAIVVTLEAAGTADD